MSGAAAPDCGGSRVCRHASRRGPTRDPGRCPGGRDRFHHHCGVGVRRADPGSREAAGGPAGRAPGAGPRLVGQGMALTSVLQGDVTLGVAAARPQLEERTGPLEPALFLAKLFAGGRVANDGAGLTEDDCHGCSRSRLGCRRRGEVPDRRPHADADLCRIAEVKPNWCCGPAGWKAATSTPSSTTPPASRNCPMRPMVVYGGNSAVADEARNTLESEVPRADHQQRVPGRGQAGRAPGPRRHPRCLRGTHCPRPGHGAHPSSGQREPHDRHRGRRRLRRNGWRRYWAIWWSST